MSNRKSNAAALALKIAIPLAALALGFFYGAAAHAESFKNFSMDHGSNAPAPYRYEPRDSQFTSRLSNGYTVSTRCHHSVYDGTTCSSQSSGSILGDNAAPSAPVEDIEAPANWAAQCKGSCVDLSK